MSFYIPNYCNVIIDRKKGDGFRLQALPTLNYENSVIISTVNMIKHSCYKGKNAITIYKLPRLIESGDHEHIKTIYIDTSIPRIRSKAFKALKKLCEDRRIVFIQLPHDLSALAAVMELISVTGKKIKTVEFSLFQFMQR